MRLIFTIYLNNQIAYLVEYTEEHELSDEVIKLAAGPVDQASRFTSYNVNQFRFRTRSTDTSKVTNNSGVCLDVNLRSYSSIKDAHPASGDVTFYGELDDIIEVDYTRGTKFVLFKCDWIDNNKGVRKDEFKFISVNFNHLLYKDNKPTDEPFILASQARQVIYVQDPVEPDWHVVLKMTCKDSLDDCDSNDKSFVAAPQIQPFGSQHLEVSRMISDDDSTWLREGGEEMIISSKTIAKAVTNKKKVVRLLVLQSYW